MEKLSYLHHEGKQPLLFTTLSSLLDKRATTYPKKPAHVFHTVTSDAGKIMKDIVTFQDLAEKSLNVASKLLEIGIGPRQSAVLFGSDVSECLYFEHACIRLGIKMLRSPITKLDVAFFVQYMEKSKANVLVLEKNLISEELEAVIPGLGSGKINGLQNYGLEFVKHVILLKKSSYSECMSITEISKQPARNVERVKEIQSSIDPDETCATFSTSGTTGFPKFVELSHFSLINGYFGLCNEIFKLHLDDAVLFNHCPCTYGGSYLYAPVIFGCTWVNVDNNIKNGKHLLEIFEAEKVTDGMFLLPFLHLLMQTLESDKTAKIPSTLANIVTGGNILQDKVLQFAINNFKQVSVAYGTNETVTISCSTMVPGSTDYTVLKFMQPTPRVELKVTDYAGNILPRGEIGYVHIRSPYVMKGYLDPVKTSKVLSASKWYNAGDLGMITEDGKFELLGRDQDVFQRGDTSINPKGIVHAFQEHQQVDWVIVIPVPDKELTNEICVCILPKTGQTVTEEQLKSFSQDAEKNLPGFHIPKYYYIVKDFPKLVTGKIDSTTLVKEAKQYLELN